MVSVKKAPRRTAERILLASLELFNRFGVPNVSTTMIAADLGISPGNLYYHYPAKDELINGLFTRYESALAELLPASQSVRDVEDAWFFMHSLFELVWQYRFLYRDLNDLLSNNRLLETHFQAVVHNKTKAMRQLLNSMSGAGHLRIDHREIETTANNMVVVVTYWLSFEYVQNPRQALETGNAQMALLRGAQHALQVLAPFLENSQRQHLLGLSEAYGLQVNATLHRNDTSPLIS